jgi:outer membrane lipoprotein-sorting protein
MKLLLLPLLFTVSAQGGDDAEKRFRAMEAKVRQADALQVAFDCDLMNKLGTIKGSMIVRAGNKARLEMQVDFAGKEMKLLMVSDGSKMVANMDGVNQTTQDTPKFLRDALQGLAAKAGVVANLMVVGKASNEQKNPLEGVKLSDFKALPNEQVNGRDAAVIAYKVSLADNQNASVTVWIDTATNLPLKRTLRMDMNGGGPNEFTETYREFRLNPQLDARLFELPNAKGEAK